MLLNLECPVGLSQREICAYFNEGNLAQFRRSAQKLQMSLKIFTGKPTCGCMRLVKNSYQTHFKESLNNIIKKSNGTGNKMRTYQTSKQEIHLETYLIYCLIQIKEKLILNFVEAITVYILKTIHSS